MANAIEAKRGRTWYVLMLGAFALLTLVMTWPVAARLATELAGGREDLWVHQWTFWWVKQALLEGRNPFYTTYLYYPNGVALTSHNIAWFNIAVWLPLQALFGNIAAYNLFFLAVFTLNGFCMALFAAELLPSRWAAFVAGLVYGYWPYTMSHYDHANMFVIFWVPLILLFMRRTLLHGRRRDALLTAVFLTMLGITRWQLLIMSGPILLLFGLYLLYKHPDARGRQALGRLTAAVVLAGLLMAPLAAPLLIDQVTRDNPEDAFLDEREWGRTDLAAYVTPSVNNGLWRAYVLPRYEPFTVNRIYIAYLGFTTLLLATVGLIGRWRQTRFWLLLALLYVVFALGPVLAINGRSLYDVFMPARLVENTAVWQILRRPDRLNVFLSLPLAMLVGWGIVTLRQWPRGRFVPALGFLLPLLLLLDLASVPFTTTPVAIPAWYKDVAAMPGEFATLDLPIGDREYDKWYMLYQTQHGKPIVGGHVSRLPREAFDFLDSTPFLRRLRVDNLMPLEIADTSRQLRALADANVPFLVLHKTFAHEGLLTIWRDWLTIQPFYEDDDVVVFHTDPRYGRDFTWQRPLSDAVGTVSTHIAPTEAVQQGVVKVDVRWGTAAAPGANLNACFRLEDAAGARPQCFPLVEGWPTAVWGADEVARGFYILPISADVAPGVYDLTLTLQDAAGGETVGQPAILETVTVHPFAPEAETAVSWSNPATAGDAISLRGYDLADDGDTLNLTLYWQAETRPSASYKVFVHLADPRSGAIVAQSDAIPRDWTYRTTAWEPGEIVRDVVSLPLQDVPPGVYDVRVGLYEETSGARLPLAPDGAEFAVLTKLTREEP